MAETCRRGYHFANIMADTTASAARQVLGALGYWPALTLAVLGLGLGATQLFVAHAEFVRFDREGQRLPGRVLTSSHSIADHSIARRQRDYSTVGVGGADDVWPTFSVPEVLPVGQPISAICLRSAGRCMSVAEVTRHIHAWPWTTEMIVAAALVIAGGALGLAIPRQRSARKV
jgi:hypothetical protein